MKRREFSIALFAGTMSLFLVSCLSHRVPPEVNEWEIRAVVMRDHVSTGFSDHYPYLNFLDVRSSYESNALSDLFVGTRPTIFCGTNRVVYGDFAVAKDSRTGLRACVYTVTIDSITPPFAKATSEAYTANTGAESFLYTLVYTNQHWIIVNRVQGPMS
jgi:hypothetical protein